MKLNPYITTLDEWTRLMDAYLWVKRDSYKHGYGICMLVRSYTEFNCVGHVAKVAQQFPWHALDPETGAPDWDHPVATIKNRNGEKLYHDTTKMWDRRTEYGRNRWQLLDACIDDCRANRVRLLGGPL